MIRRPAPRIGLIRGGCLALLVMLLLASCSPAQPLQSLWDAPQFDLTDEGGQPFSSDRLAGKVWLADFIYTNCPDECPIYLSPKMMALQKEILARNLAGQAQLLSLTVDPARDTPAVLADYGRRYHADSHAWHFLTGPNATLQPLLQTGFKVGSAVPSDSVQVATGAASGATPQPQAGGDPPGDGSYTLVHTAYFLLVDRHGKVRAIFDGEQVKVAEMLRGMQTLIDER